MEHTTLRLILFVCGILVIAGIYFFDYIGRKKDKIARDNRQEPLISNEQASMDRHEILAEDEISIPSDEEINQIPLTEDDLEAADLREMILQIHVVSKSGEFNGLDIQAIAQQLDLIPAMDIGIYDRRLGDSKNILYSMANLVQPGVFTFKNMSDFSTPGVALFGRLPGIQHGLTTYSDMLECAEQMAIFLDGELQDASHSDLTHQTIEHTREQIQEYERKIFLLKHRKAHKFY